MTEAEARQRWCPFAASRVVSFMDQTIKVRMEAWCKPDDAEKVTVTCLGSACMAWRWDGNIPGDGAVRHGHCGLAGKP